MKVAVVGLGPAGIYAAKLLERAGVEVELFEALSRPGGRLWTVTDEGGPIYDLGGEWIDADHARCLALIEEQNQVPRKTCGDSLVCYKGEVASERNLWPDAATDAQRIESLAAEYANSPANAPYSIDSSLATFLNDTCSSERGRCYAEAYYRSDEGEDTSEIGLFGWLSGFVNYVGREEGTLSAFRFPGGAGDFFGSILNMIDAKPRYQSVLLSVKQSNNTVTLAFDDGFESVVDRAIITIPPKCLLKVAFSPALPEEQLNALHAIGMSRIVKIALCFDSSFWEELGWNGSMLFDSFAQQTWHGSLSDRPVLMAYICGEDSRRILQRQDPVESVLNEIANLFPRAKTSFLDARLYDWTTHPFSLGGFSHIPPCVSPQTLTSLREPHGRVFLAGEHTADWLGFIEGALESAERSVAAILS